MYTFHENISSLYFYTYIRYVRAKMTVHAFMIELDQPIIHIQEK